MENLMECNCDARLGEFHKSPCPMFINLEHWTYKAAEHINDELQKFALKHHRIEGFYPGIVPMQSIIAKHLKNDVPPVQFTEMI